MIKVLFLVALLMVAPLHAAPSTDFGIDWTAERSRLFLECERRKQLGSESFAETVEVSMMLYDLKTMTDMYGQLRAPDDAMRARRKLADVCLVPISYWLKEKGE